MVKKITSQTQTQPEKESLSEESGESHYKMKMEHHQTMADLHEDQMELHRLQAMEHHKMKNHYKKKMKKA